MGDRVRGIGAPASRGQLMQVVVHRPTTSGVWLWIQAELVERDFILEVHDGGGVVACWQAGDVTVPPAPVVVDRPPRSEWRPEDHEPHHLLTNVARGSSDTRLWWARLAGLGAGGEYTVRYRPTSPAAPPSGSVTVASFRTLPASLERGPLRVLLASCYCEDRDEDGRRSTDALREATLAAAPPRWSTPFLNLLRRRRRARIAASSLARTGPIAADPHSPVGPVAKAVASVLGSDHRPDVTFLVGDQVYLDAPIGDFVRSLSSATMKRHISRTYSRSWEKLAPLLANGGNYFLSDDHEYWNNYPANPLAWPALLPARARRRWELHARDFMFAIQAPAPVIRLDVGTPRELAFCLVDTRMHRDAPRLPLSDTDDFMRAPDLEEVIGWIGSLDAPGVLVLGQPLVAAPGGWRRAKDRGLPDFEPQYTRLCDALRNSVHDVLVLTGDIHYGRYTRIDLDASARTLHELVSSPLTLLPGAGGHPKKKEKQPVAFPLDSEAPWGTATFTDPLKGTGDPSWRPPWWAPWRKEPCHDHFMTIAFSREGGGAIGVDVTVHLIRPGDSPQEPPPLERMVLR